MRMKQQGLNVWLYFLSKILCFNVEPQIHEEQYVFQLEELQVFQYYKAGSLLTGITMVTYAAPLTCSREG